MERDHDRTESTVSPDALERERLQTYLDWGGVRAPVWYWPGLAVAISLWLVGMGYGYQWSIPGAALVMLVSLIGIRVISERSQVSMPRFRGMPAPLLRAYIPGATAAVAMVGVLAFLALTDDANVLVGAMTGPLVALGGAWTSGRYRQAADQLATSAGLDR